MKPVKTVLLIAVAALAANATYLPAQTEALIHIFTNSPDGAQPWGGLLLSAGTLYGTTYQGGDTNANGGILYSVNTDGTGYTVLYDFTNTPDGAVVYAGLVSQGDTLYGATAGGGTNYSGTIFSIKTNGDGYVVLHNFNLYSGGQHPHARLVLSGNTLYGTAAGDASPGWGAVFSMNTDGSDYTPLYDFTSPVSNGQFLTNADGEQPGGGVVLSGGTLYGTAYGGGANGVGTVYSLSTNGDDFTVLHTFAKTTFDPTYGMTNPDGAYLQAGLAGSGNTLYGTVLNGGSQGRGTVFSVNTDGSGFKVLHTFLANGQDGQHPWGSLLLAGQTLYGTTIGGGTNGRGTVFSINSDGSGYTMLRSFLTSGPDGADPVADLVVSGNTLYGTTRLGNTGAGTVFSLAIPAPAPRITSLGVAGTNLVIAGTNGQAGRTYTLLMSADVASPLTQWMPVATNVLAGNGNFTITATNAVAPAAPQRYYILRVQ